MKFLLEFVYCCGAGAAMPDGEEGSSAGNPPREEERRSLVPLARRYKRRLRARMRTSGSVPPEWTPSLGVISEDTVVAEKKRSAESDGAVKRRAAGSKARVHVRTHSDDFGRSNYAQAIPAFSPAPFMF